MRPTREEVEAVDREIDRMRRRVRRRERKVWKKLLFPAPPVKTDMTSWFTKYTDPKKIYKGNTDHWAKRRVQADRFVAQKLAKEDKQLTGDLKPAAGCTTLPFIWSHTKAKLLQDKPFPLMVHESLQDCLPGCLSEGLHKNYDKADIRWPDNIFRRQALENYEYWPREDLTNSPFIYRRKDTKDVDPLAL